VALVFAFFMRERAVALTRRILAPVSRKLADRVTGMLDAFIRGLHLGSAARVLGVLGLTVMHWILQTLGFWLIAPAFHLQLGGLQAATVVAANVVGQMIPAGPAAVGTAQYATQAGLAVFYPGALSAAPIGVQAAAYAYAIWLLQFAQQVLLGLVFLMASHESLTGLFDRSEPPETAPTDPKAALG
jgi:uncharacterized membrane protein YbhN (UPF0104 family)